MKEMKMCRLITGEFLIGTLLNTKQSVSGDTEYEIEDPALFDVAPGEKPGEMLPQFQSLIPGGRPGDCVDIKHRDVMFWVKRPHEGIEKAYKDAISVIVTPGGTKNG